MPENRFVIIGGDAAGMSAATAIRRLLPDASITVFEQTVHFSYAQCGLPYVISGDIPSTDNLVARTQAAFQQKYNINALDQHQVLSINRSNKSVEVKHLQTGQVFQAGYDRLLIATGARPMLPNWPGRQLKGVLTFKTIPDAHYLDQLLAKAEKVVIVGGGYVGLEMAEACRSRQKSVTLVDLAPQVAPNVDPELAALAQMQLEENQVAVYLEEEVAEFKGSNGQVVSVVTGKREIPADVVIVAIGAMANSELARDCGLEVGPKGGIMVNEYLRTADPFIWAAGDCALHYHRLKEKDDFIPLGTTANKQGQLAGLNMAGQERPFQGIVGTAIMKIFNLALARTGLSTREAQQLSIPFSTVQTTTKHHAGYYPGAKPLAIKLLYHPETQVLLGGQAVGEQGADKFIDVLATALYHKMTIGQLEDLDLAYAPPFSTVWAPLQQAARMRKRG